MLKKKLLSAVTVIAAFGALAGPALASGGTGSGGGTGGGGTGGGGTGGGGTTTTLPAPPIPPATFAGIGPGPVYIHESFGTIWSSTRYRADGKVIKASLGDAVAGVRAEYPNNQAESWIGPNVTSGALRWQWVDTVPDDFEQYSQLQDNAGGFYTDGAMQIVGEPGAPETRPDILLPFPAPTTSASTVSFDDSDQASAKTDVGFTNSSATNNNFATNGLVWIEIGSAGGPDPLAETWTFHTNGLTGATASGTVEFLSPTRTRVAVSYDPVNHIAEATINGNLVASIPYTAPAIKYVGAEGTTSADVDNFSVWSGSATDPMPASIAPPSPPNDISQF